ncbi:hypothetical protein [Ferruginibacter sp.]|nr:HlyD family efflux transporter periplasmic adaptor subunit [Ferruginibacter sp.]
MPIEINDTGEIIELPAGENGSNHLLRSTEVTELISKKPSFIVQWGIVILFLIAICLLTVTWFIRYPDIVPATGILNSINAPKEVMVKMSGKLVKLFVKENQPVLKNEVLGFIESTASHTEVIRLEAILDTISKTMQNNRSNEVAYFLATDLNNLGELQTAYQIFSQSLQDFGNYLKNGFYLRKKAMLAADMSYLQRLHTELFQQKKLLTQDLALTDSTFQAQESLKNDKVISTMDYRNEKSKLIARQMTLPQVNSSIITNESQQHEKLKEIAELENQIQQQKNIFIQSVNTIKSQVEDWKKKYLLVAPVDGKVSFATFLQENQELKIGQLIAYVNPGNSDYYIEATVPQYNFGKVTIGQEVLLKFPAYPYSEFGTVKGKISFINNMPTDSGYLAKIILPDGLVTNYKKRLHYHTGLAVQADIVTAKMRLLERLFNNARKKMNN